MRLEAKYTPRDTSPVWDGHRYYGKPTPPTVYFRYANGKSAGRIHGTLAIALAKRHELKAWCLWTEIDGPVVLLENGETRRTP